METELSYASRIVIVSHTHHSTHLVAYAALGAGCEHLVKLLGLYYRLPADFNGKPCYMKAGQHHTEYSPPLINEDPLLYPSIAKIDNAYRSLTT